MWWGRVPTTRRCAVWIGADAVHWAWRPSTAADWHTGTLPLEAPLVGRYSEDLAELGEPLRRLSGEIRASGVERPSISVVVSESWLVSAVLPWSDDLLAAESPSDVGRAQCEEAGFRFPGDAAVVCDPGEFGQPYLLTAIPSAFLQTLRDLAIQCGGELHSVRSIGHAAYGAVRRRSRIERGEIWLLEKGSRTRLSFDEGRLAALQTSRLSADDAEGEMTIPGLVDPTASGGPAIALPLDKEPRPCAADSWSSAMAPMDLLPGVALALTKPSPRERRLSFVPVRPMRSAARLLLPVLAIAFGLSVLQAWQMHAAAERDRAERHADAARAAALPARRLTTGEIVRVNATNRAIRQINGAGLGLIEALAPLPDSRVYLLGADLAIDQEQTRRVARIRAEAETESDMTRYLVRLGEMRGLRSIQLSQHESSAKGGPLPVAFVAEAVWDE